MSRGTSSLRHTARKGGLLACACGFALALTSPAFTASLPTPDDPPSGTREEAAPVAGTTSAPHPGRLRASGSITPTPDAPATQAASTTATVATPPARPSPKDAAAPSPASAPTPTAPSSTASAHAQGSTVSPSTTSTSPPARAARTTPPKAKPVATPKRKTRPTHHPTPTSRPHRAAPAEVAATGPPHDRTTLGLPVGTPIVVAIPADGTPDGALLAAAALLLAAAAAGGLVVGVFGRRLAGPA